MVNVFDCQNLDLEWTVNDPNVFEMVEDHVVPVPGRTHGKKACVARRFRAIGEGSTCLKISYTQCGSGKKSKETVLDAIVTLAAFRPLEVLLLLLLF